MTKITKTYRLSLETIKQLEDISKSLGKDNTKTLESIINTYYLQNTKQGNKELLKLSDKLNNLI